MLWLRLSLVYTFFFGTGLVTWVASSVPCDPSGCGVSLFTSGLVIEPPEILARSCTKKSPKKDTVAVSVQLFIAFKTWFVIL